MQCLVWGVGVLVLLIVASAWWCVFVPWGWWGTPVGLFNLVLSHSLLGLMLYSYHATITTSPGCTPPGWIPPGASAEQLQKAIDDEEEYQRLKRRRRGRPQLRPREKDDIRYCAKCQEFKPPRAHHCSDCRRCTLKMDHHCPWVDNCVGQNNHKTFILFLFYAIITLSYAIVLFAVRLFDIYIEFSVAQAARNAAKQAMEDPPPLNMKLPAMHMAISSINMVIIIPIVLSMTCLLVYQLGILSQNVTTIEDYEREFLKKRYKQQGKVFVWPYDLGSCRENYQQVLGSDIKQWVVPWAVSAHERNDQLVLGTDSKDTV